MKLRASFLNSLRFLGLWFGFSGLYAMFAVCPFCGRPGCPVGAGVAGVVGAAFTLLKRLMDGFLHRRATVKKESREGG
jgi:hypothetical protein